MSRKTYVHYGSSLYDKKLLRESVKNYSFINPYKPEGLWGTPVSAEFGWKDWCIQADYNMNKLHESFVFSVKEEARILYINTLEKAKPYMKEIESEYGVKGKKYYNLDLEKIYENFDGMELCLQDDPLLRRNNIFNIWDVDSICVWNPDMVVQEESEEKEEHVMYVNTIVLRAKTNFVRPWINQAIFKLKDGQTVALDREETGYTVSGPVLDMTICMIWRGVYLWNSDDDEEGAYYDVPEDMFEGAKLVELEVEDDAPEDYFCNPFECYVGSTKVEVGE